MQERLKRMTTDKDAFLNTLLGSRRSKYEVSMTYLRPLVKKLTFPSGSQRPCRGLIGLCKSCEYFFEHCSTFFGL